MIQRMNQLTSEQRLNKILDKILSGQELTMHEKMFLDAWKVDQEEIFNDLLNSESAEFISDNGHFRFVLNKSETIDDCTILHGSLTIPDPMVDDFKLTLNGSIIVFRKEHVAIDFRIEEVDLFELIEGHEEYLDDFVCEIAKSL